MTDLEALAVLRILAKRYCAVELSIADCGCHTVTLFVGGDKIVEEDKDLPTCVGNVLERIENVSRPG